jgi:hypothetical protein
MATARVATACSCGVAPPCALYGKADEIFIGVVTDTGPERLEGPVTWVTTRMVVSQTIRGRVEGQIVLTPSLKPAADWIAQVSAETPVGADVPVDAVDCDYTFERGRQYLVYARRTSDGRLTATKCMGTKPLEDAAEDLEFFNIARYAPDTSRIFGTVRRQPVDPGDGRPPPASGVTVSVRGRDLTRLTTTTDDEGRFELNVPAGEYDVSPVVPRVVRVYGTSHVVAPARGCAPVSLLLAMNGRIEGRVVLENGKPVPRIVVSVMPEQETDEPVSAAIAHARSTMSNEDGEFAVDPLPAGRYHVVVNGRSGPTVAAPYAVTYYPGVSDRREAQAIELEEGGRASDVVVTLVPLPVVTVSGVVMTSDGQPVPATRVVALRANRDTSAIDTAVTDARGSFRLRVPAGEPYVFRALMPGDPGVQVDVTQRVERAVDDLVLVVR